jgi:fructose-bisphosphate aldolase class 1
MDEENKRTNRLVRSILKTIGNEYPHVVMSALTIAMARVIVLSGAKAQDESIMETANETLGDAIREERRLHGTAKH